MWVLLYVPLLFLPILIGSFLQPALISHLGTHWWTFPTLLEAVFAAGGLALYRFARRKVEDRILAEQRRYQTVLRQASQGMTLIRDLGRLLQLIVHLVTIKVRVKHAAIYLWEAREKKFILKAARHWPVKWPPQFARQDPLAETIHWSRTPLVTEELELRVKNGQARFQPVVEVLKGLEAAVLIPSFVENRCLGFLVLGEKASGIPYSSDDLLVFQVMANQAALGIENAQFYEELKRTQADLIQTSKMASLGHMAGGMSHQVNNRFHVLTILAGTTKAMMDTLGPDPATVAPEKLREFWKKLHEVFDRVEQNALQGGGIVKNILRFSRPSGEHKPVKFSEIISTAREVAQYRVNLNLIDWIVDLPEGIPATRGDLNLLADCLLNLITNAFDAMQRKADLIQERKLSRSSTDPDPYKGRLKIRARLESRDQKPWVVLEVQDNGVGMSARDLDCLFIPFFTTKATAQKGTGLGLYVIQRILEQHGGAVSAGSSYGVGTTFTLRLPALEEAKVEPVHA